MKKVLITGAKGFLGRNVARYFKNLGCETFGIGHGDLSVHECKNIGLDYWIKSDVTLKAMMDLRQKFDVIIHCGGSGSVGFSVEHPYDDFKKTVDGTLEVLEYMRLYNPQAQLLYPSSPAVYGEQPNAPIREECDRTPVSPYGYHKKIVEDLCRSYSQKYDLNIKIIRLFSVYGEGLQKQLLWDTCRKLSRDTSLTPFWGTGEETRDFIHIHDVLSLIRMILDQEDRFMIVNGGSGASCTISSVVRQISALLGSDKEIRFNNEVHTGNPIYYWADIHLLEKIGWKPTVDFADGLSAYVHWFKML